MLAVTFYSLDGDANPRVFGRVYWDGTRVWTDAPKLGKEITRPAVVPHRGRVRPDEDPALWMENLCHTYRGSAFWAGPAEPVTPPTSRS